MAEALLLGGAVSALMQALVTNIESGLKEEWRLLKNVKQEVRGLKKVLVMIQALLEDAEERHLKEKMVETWLGKLKDAAYDAEDVVDEFSTDALRWKLEGSSGDNGAHYSIITRRIQRWFLSCSSSIGKAVSHRNTAVRVKAVKDQLDGVLALGRMIELRQLDVIRISETPVWRQTSSLPEENIIGRDEERDQIIQMLKQEPDTELGSSDRNVPVLAIIGIGGVGKTTLAQHVYNDSRMKEKFELMMWVCVADDFNVERLTRVIIESVTKVTPKQTSFNNLQLHLKEVLQDKTFFLVLDDVWNTDMRKWENLRKPFKYGGKDSRILTTTRSHDVAHAMGAMNQVPLGGLPDRIYKHFFERCAFGDDKVARMYPRLRNIGWQIARKLGGSPLAAKTLGRLLSTRLDEVHWKRVQESELWELPHNNETDILPALRLSYMHLPAPLKRCFAYCCVFPKDHLFERSVLVQLWMAHGFIRDASMEDVGNSYFDDLLNRCFFQYARIVRDCERYTMHDLIHDLASSVSMNESYTVSDDHQHPPRAFPTTNSTKARHISSSSLEVVLNDQTKSKSLRSFISLNKIFNRGMDLPADLFVHFSCLRVLDLSDSGLKELPESVGDLAHLRYLSLSFNPIRRLPESLGRLHNLQTLKLEECSRLSELPRGASNLINLRLLLVPEYTEAGSSFKIAGLGRLTSLRGLKGFRVSKVEGQRILELKELNELRGSISIRNLKEVGSGGEAGMAELKKKLHLDDVSLVWSDAVGEQRTSLNNDSMMLDEDVLERLQPHPNLKRLEIIHYGGVRSPSWMEKGLCSNLQVLTLFGCAMWESLPPLGQLCSLRELYVIGLSAVKKVGQQFLGGGDGEVKGFPALETLKFDVMHGLESWEWNLEEEGHWFPQLSKFEIRDCPKLRELPLLGKLPALKQLEMWNCNQMEAMQERSLPQSLEKLLVFGCGERRKLPADLDALEALQRLELSHCPKLEFMPMLPPRFQSVSIVGCPLLKTRAAQSLLHQVAIMP